MTEASWYMKLEEGKVRCVLCPHQCLLVDGEHGKCRVRTNIKGLLMTEIFGQVSAMHSDPIEKKPLYHFYPGKNIFSIGSVGCNLHCRFCQNSEISQVTVRESHSLKSMTALEIIEKALNSYNNIGIAYTYNEPSIWIEFVEQVARVSSKKGLKNIMVTNGFINPNPLQEMIGYMDAFSIDLKAFTESFYHSVTSSNLAPVKKTLEMVSKSGRHLEIVNLVIPGLNDDPSSFEEMVRWIAGTLGPGTVLHLSAYYPRYLANEPPTPASTIMKLRSIACKYLTFVYSGNVSSEQNETFCPQCHQLLINRKGYRIDIPGVDANGACTLCGNLVFENF